MNQEKKGEQNMHMPRGLTALGIFLVALVPAALAIPTIASGDEAAMSASILEGVFTEEQAERGKEIYDDECRSCHAPNLRGTPGGPSLLGNRFNNRWVGGTLADLYTFIHDNMPAGQGGSLTEQQYIDVAAYILSRQDYPAGDEELPADPEVLAGIEVVEAP